MAVFTYSLDDAIPPACTGGAITIGNFDGVHLGHQALLGAAISQARRGHGPAVAVTFDPHPFELLRPDQFQPVLTTTQQRAELLQQFGADHVLILSTTRELLNLSARAFFHGIVHERVQAKAVVEGPNFGFGKNREGNVVMLQALGKENGIHVVIVPPKLWEGKPISSSRVRNELVAGNVARACTMLGRPYVLTGAVIPGQKRGQSLGFPTANLGNIPTLIPGDGVYAVRVRHADKTWAGAANLGPNPTFAEDARKVEVHLIDFNGDLYGRELTIEFLDKLRDTRAFAGPSELSTQLQQDITRAKDIAQRSI